VRLGLKNTVISIRSDLERADLEASWAKRNPNEARLELFRQLVGTDIPTDENIVGTFKEIRKAEAAIASVPEELKGEPEYEQATQAQGLLVERFEALNTKRTLQDRVQNLVRATSERLDLQAVGKLLNDNVTLSKEIAPVLEQIKTLAAALDIALDTPLQIPVKGIVGSLPPILVAWRFPLNLSAL
jgi:hypothetical protein